MRADLESRFADHLGTLGLSPGPVLLGVSGGSDSLALLLLMHRVAAPMGHPAIVAHADHGLHPDSGTVARAVRDRAASLGVRAVVGRLDLPAGAGETEARQSRHAWLRQVRLAEGARYLALAHHRTDQAETVLMRVLAGSGPAGLAAMQPLQGDLLRPLLPFLPGELAAYREAAGWPAWQDPANRDPRHTRSWLRGAVMPLLINRDPAVVDHLVRVAAQAADARRAWDSVLDLLPGLACTPEMGGVSVAAAPLAGYDSGLVRTVIQALGRRVGAVVGPAAAGRALELVLAGRSGAWVPLGGGWRAELVFDRLRLVHEAPRDALGPAVIGETPSGAVRRGPWAVSWRSEPAPDRIPRDGWTSWFIPGACTVRGWAAGDRIRPRGGVGRRLVVRCMQDARVPRADRDTWPVLVAPGAGPILWIPGICRAEDALPPSGSEAMRIDVEPG